MYERTRASDRKKERERERERELRVYGRALFVAESKSGELVK